MLYTLKWVIIIPLAIVIVLALIDRTLWGGKNDESHARRTRRDRGLGAVRGQRVNRVVQRPRWLLNDMKVAGVNVEVRGLWERFEVCQGRIAARFGRGEISAAGTGGGGVIRRPGVR